MLGARWPLGEQSKLNIRPAIAPILMEIHERSLRFLDFALSYVNRLCNKVAHVLAKQADGQEETVVWYESPSCIHSLLVADCNHAP